MFQRKAIHTKILSILIVGLFLTMLFPSVLFARAKEFELNCPYWYMWFDRAGYVDITYWYTSPMHPFPAHEMMTGDWAAAVYYDGISADDKAEWLTDRFEVPSFDTGQVFGFPNPASDFYEVSNDPCNPVWDLNQPSPSPYNPYYKYDTGWSTIEDPNLRVNIYYEVVDLDEYGWSPLSFVDANESQYVKSERYVLLQTYEFENISGSDVTGLEFYQMLHGHPANGYSNLAGSYNDADISDDLESYTPFDPNHQTGNFRYDMTLWNEVTPYGQTDHFDYMSFSSTIEPNDVDLGEFADYSKPTTGTYVNVMDRNLNGLTSFENNTMAGAMSWNLPDLSPGETTSITLALMYGSSHWPFPTVLTKTNADPNNDCVHPLISEQEHNLVGTPYNWLEYDIAWDANGYALDDVVITDYLPLEVDEPNYISDSGVYDSNTHTVTWNIPTVAANDSDTFRIQVGVNHYAKPGGTFSNFVQMQCSEGISAATTTDVNVCYDGYGMDIIYVDKDATSGFNNGTSWDNAYLDLRDAFAGAESGGALVTAIWVAEGTYKPVYDTNDTSYKNESFNLVEDVGVFGHFSGTEGDIAERDFSDANNTTTLEGQIGESISYAVYDILKADNIEDAILDGFTIRGAYSGSGIYLNASDVSIVNCKFKSNRNYGIEATNYSYPDIHNCLFMDNTSQGINISSYCWPEISYCTLDGNDTTPDGVFIGNSVVVVENSVFKDHTDNGIEGSDGTLTVTNCDFSNDNDNAVQITDITTIMTNCSIKDCGDDGIYANDSDLTIDHTVISNSADNALYTTGGCNLTLKNSVVRYCGESGLELNGNYATTIKNNWIHDNGTDEYAYYGGSGIWFTNQVSVPLVRNNTIYNNYTYGIESSENGADANVINSIIYGNDSNDFYRVNGTFDTVNYCNLQNSHAGTGNITGDPGFENVATDPCDLHLAETSQCKDAGDPNGSYNPETDIDGEDRIYYDRVDIGADEYYWSPADFDEDGIVNLIDYATFAAAWQTDSGDGNYNDYCDLEDTNSIDVNDLALFCEDWLWETATDTGWMMAMGGGGGSTLESMSMMIESSFLGLEESPSITPAEKPSGDDLMLSAAESMAARPERLIEKSRKFYNITPQSVAEAKIVKPKPPTLREQYEIRRELLDWLDKMWLSGEFDEALTEKQFLEFREAVEKSADF